MSHSRHISVIGLGYVGLPVAVSFGQAGNAVIAFDINQERLDALSRGEDATGEVSPDALESANLTLTSAPQDLQKADFHIVTVPTPIDADNKPDLSPLISASRTLGSQLKKGAIVVYESTVYPGVTEEVCGPILEAESGLKCGADFTLGYSPERINPGDKVHRFESIVKVVSGQDARTLDIVAQVYESVVKAGVHRAPTIKTAESAKVIENTQRDLNIALMNELAIIFHKMNINTADVLEAAATKWNFLPFSPGLVGGHCIGVDPYYLTHKAEALGYHPEVILSGRRINDSMGNYIAEQMRSMLQGGEKEAVAPKVAILGLTFKENVPDLRNSKVVQVMESLARMGFEVVVHDPAANPEDAKSEYGINLCDLDQVLDCDGVIVAVPHRDFVTGGWKIIQKILKNGQGPVVDVRGALSASIIPNGISYWRL